MNVELLRKIAQVIQEKPQEFDITKWHGFNDCGTTHCIAGWAEALTTRGWRRVNHDNIPVRARRKLDITHEQALKLFYAENWPDYFTQPHRMCVLIMDTTPEQAAARIEHFIATDGKE